MASGAGSGPCGACKFLRRKCAAGCVFAPYFCCSEQGPERFAAVHRVFGASNASKLLQHVPPRDRCEAAVTIAYEAQARIADPVYGCVAHIFALQQQVASLQFQLMEAKAELGHKMANGSSSPESQDWQDDVRTPAASRSYPHGHGDPFSPQSSLDCIDYNPDANSNEEVYLPEDNPMHPRLRNRGRQYCDMGELQDLALRMIRS